MAADIQDVTTIEDRIVTELRGAGRLSLDDLVDAVCRGGLQTTTDGEVLDVLAELEREGDIMMVGDMVSLADLPGLQASRKPEPSSTHPQVGVEVPDRARSRRRPRPEAVIAACRIWEARIDRRLAAMEAEDVVSGELP